MSVRATQESVKERQDEISRLRMLIDRAKKLEMGKGTPFWDELKKTIEFGQRDAAQKKNAVLDQRTNNTHADLANAKMYRATEYVFGSIIEDVEKASEVVDVCNTRIQKLQAELKAIEESGAIVQ